MSTQPKGLAQMKLNFWQLLGLVVLISAAAYMIYQRTGVRPAAPVEPTAPPSQLPPPTTVQSTTSPAALKSVPIPTH